LGEWVSFVQLAAHFGAGRRPRLCCGARGRASRGDESRAALLATGAEPDAGSRWTARLAQPPPQPALVLRLKLPSGGRFFLHRGQLPFSRTCEQFLAIVSSEVGC